MASLRPNTPAAVSDPFIAFSWGDQHRGCGVSIDCNRGIQSLTDRSLQHYARAYYSGETKDCEQPNCRLSRRHAHGESTTCGCRNVRSPSSQFADTHSYLHCHSTTTITGGLRTSSRLAVMTASAKRSQEHSEFNLGSLASNVSYGLSCATCPLE